MTEKVARIRKVFLGFEEHGHFTCALDLDYGGSGQHAGLYDLRGSGGSDWLMRLLRACGVKDFSQLEGRTIVALFKDSSPYGLVAGIKALPMDEGEPFIFEDWTADHA